MASDGLSGISGLRETGATVELYREETSVSDFGRCVRRGAWRDRVAERRLGTRDGAEVAPRMSCDAGF